MLSLLPVFLLLLSAMVIQVVGRVTRRAGSTWWLATILGFLTWIAIILVGLLKPPAMVINDWLPGAPFFATIVFETTNVTWVFCFLLVTMLEAVILFSARHLQSPFYLNKITGSMVITAFGLLAVLSRSNLAYVLTWSLIDLAEFGVLAAVIGNVKNHQSKITSVLFRAIGIILLVMVISISPEQGELSDRSQALVGWLLVLIVVLRMGILPLRPHYPEDIRIHRGLVTILRILPVITAFSYITTVSGNVLPEKSNNALLFILTIAVLYGSIAWFFSKEELSGRPYWVFTLGCLGVVSYLDGTIEPLIGLAVVTLIAGTGIFLYSPKFHKVYPFIPLLLVGMLTFPFTPTSSLTLLFTGNAFSIYDMFSILGYAFLLAGAIKHSLVKDDNPDLSEPWIQLFHSIALYFIALSPWIILGISFQALNTNGNWWVSLSIVVISIIIVTIYLLLNRKFLNPRKDFARFLKIGEKILHVLDEFFRLNWLSNLLAALRFIFEKAVSLLVRVQEGDGGILWSFLFLVLLFSLLLAQQAP